MASALADQIANPGAAAVQDQGSLAIIAGGGSIPAAVAEAALRQGRAIHVIAIRGAADAQISGFPHSWIGMGQVGKLLRLLRRHDCRDVVIVGSVRRPDLTKIRIDFGFLRHLPAILRLTAGGDDKVLSGVVKFFESKGYRVRGAHEIAPSLLAPCGPLGGLKPRRQDEADIELGLRVVKAFGAHDVGQAAVVSRGYVLAVEAAEGTDAMLRRCRGLQPPGAKLPCGVLVKCPKPGQELRTDMPAIGPRTVELAAEAGLAGIAVAAGKVLLAGYAGLLKEAEARGLFVAGVDGGQESAGE